MTRIGITLQPEREYLDLIMPVAETSADYVEVSPDTMWRLGVDGTPEPNAFHAQIHAFVERTGLPVVGHGTTLNPCGADPGDTERRRELLARIAADHETFDFAWYTDHLGATVLDGRAITLPIAPPMTETCAAIARERLAALQQIVPEVGLENSVFYFLLGDWLDEPAFLARVLDAPHTHLLLDLHNVYTMGLNLGVAPRDYLAKLDLARVIEIHLSGGSRSDPAWLPSGRTMRLDSHDNAVPEPVWDLYEEIVRVCPNLRGVTVERIEGTVAADDVGTLQDEVRRAREIAGV